MNSNKTILLTIDVEDWFQVENFKPWIPFETWDQRELRVEKNTHKLLNLFDSIELKAPQLNRFRPDEIGSAFHRAGIQRGRNSSKLIGTNDSADSMNPNLSRDARNQIKDGGKIQSSGNSYELSAMNYEKSHPKVTFFILGWIAERLPHLVREIQSRGHEVASHGYNHNPCNEQSHSDLKQELINSKKLLEDITGSRVVGFRAPNFSINNDILKMIEDCGYLYDSSYNSFGLHGRYGKIFFNGNSKKGIAHQISENFFELPISNIQFGYPLSFEPSALSTRKRFVLPFGGGAYFRLIPYRFFRHGVKSILKKDRAYVFYIHPWEVDPNQPRVDDAAKFYKFRHYQNLKNTYFKLDNLIRSFGQCNFKTCSGYLKEIDQDLL